MQIKRSVLARLIREELVRRAKQLSEAPEVVDASQDKKKKEKEKGKGEEKPTKPSTTLPQGDKAKKPIDEPKDLGVGTPQKGPAKGSAPKDVPPEGAPDDANAPTPAGDDKEDLDAGKTKISDDLAGKKVQSVTAEPVSKILPGSSEIVLTFDDTTDPLRIIITQSGGVKYFWRGALHNQI